MPMPDEPGVKLRCSYNELCDLVAQLDLRMAALEQRAPDSTAEELRYEWRRRWNVAARAAAAYRNALIDIAQIAESHAQSATAFSLIAEANSRAAAFASIAERARAALQEHPAAASQHSDPCARYDADTDVPATFEGWLIQARADDGLRPLDAWQAATARAVVIVQGYLDSYPADITLPTPSSQGAQTFYDALAPALRRALTDIIAAIKGA